MNELPIYHGPCPYCGSAISVVIQDGTTVARCSHRGCGARGPIMRSTERAVELFRAGRFASQAQAAQSVLDATARAEAAERELAAEREAHELEKRAHEHTWQQKVRQIERAEAAEKRDATRIEGIMAQIADLERDRDHWRTVAESRPDISREDAARYIAWRSGFAPNPRNFDRLQPIDDALRAHATAPKDTSEATASDEGEWCMECSGRGGFGKGQRCQTCHGTGRAGGAR